ncbi:hypothetical protein AR438_10850 [Chryseobacterium aquaticum]|uniref:Uncharacterized protein n=1 Tax=Chryseobacterium aquaticum TaxID=452084 RepID=A0A0Q3HTL2_9FLAO|nr:hypothetical protein [Chryseobacterium aquaticum]KQK26071.1 hypothetical protein AR438_10850 [Chryseobacterium aquaticum]
MMKISDLKPGQKVTIGGIPAEYKGIEKVKISNFAIVEKRVFKGKGIDKYYSLSDGSKTLKSEKIEVI